MKKRKKTQSKKPKIFTPNPVIHDQLVKQHRERIQGFKAKMDLKRNWSAKFADILTVSFGTITFLTINCLLFICWILLNSGLIKNFPIFDPYPFGMLTMVVSLEAIVLSIIVLISQNRAANIADLREEVELHINVRAEEEITKLINMVDEIHDHIGLPAEDDEELEEMKKKTDIDKIEAELQSE